ncbi:MAG: TetR/AcrR family transcriptional regulator [Cellulomonas iranensis]|uniref:TetR/AcrR family transcriptional regulator n=1 Tax=Cellulomonas iranensis TaxID=76862 RepID=UPI001B25F37C|nr:TetR/AcrR family transcriptional regulator [Cellulomonas iranensis]MBO9568471.1 TetR/AcrR family transcriptional regulator [Cellulomonas iranensis]
MAALRSDAARNRTALLDAARTARDERGYPPALADVAARAGVGVGTAYRHFPSHRALVEALALETLDPLVTAVRDAADDPAADAFGDLVVGAMRLLADDPALAEVVSDSGGAGPELRAVLDELLTAFGALLARAQAAGDVRPDLTPVDVQHLVCGMQVAVRLARTADDGAAARYASVLLHGLRP